MKDKIFKLVGDLIMFVIGLIQEAGDISKLSLRTVVFKLLKSELWVAIIGLAALVGWRKVGIPEEHLLEFFGSVTTIVIGYLAQRGYSKPKELAAGADPSKPQGI